MAPAETPQTKTSPSPELRPRSAIKQWGPLVVLIALMAFAFAMGWHKLLSFKTIGINHEALRAFIAANLAVAVLAYVAIYIAVVAL